MKLVTTAEMQALEQAANAKGLDFATMMENAGRATALAIREEIPTTSASVLVLVGPGNNGGDGLVAAHYLAEWGYPVTAYLWKRTQEQDANLERVQQQGIEVLRAADDEGFQQLGELARTCDILVDALLGTGISGELRSTLKDLLQAVQETLAARQAGDQIFRRPSHPGPGLYMEGRERPFVVAVDVPTGLNSDSGEADEATLAADLTVTFAYPKRGHYLFPGASYVGDLWVADIGLDPKLAESISLQVATPQEIARKLPARPADAHKGTFGKALIVGGSANYIGAPCMAAEAAYRSGAGLVTVGVPQRIFPMVASKLTETTFLVLPDDMGVLVPSALNVLAARLADYDAVLVGPGLGTENVTGELIYSMLGASKRAMRMVGFGVGGQAVGKVPSLKLPASVIDADALNLLAGQDSWWEYLPPQCVLTPHPGEMARLTRRDVAAIQADRVGTAREAAQQWGCVVVLKGAFTVVAAPDGQVMVIPFANSVLAAAGTGDVLAGTIVGLLAQGLSAFDAAVCAAYLHGLAGELASQEIGQVGTLAGEISTLLPMALEQVRAQ